MTDKNILKLYMEGFCDELDGEFVLLEDVLKLFSAQK